MEVLQVPKVGRGDSLLGWDPKFSLDLDGDGIFELVVEESHYDGGSTVMYYWKNGKRHKAVLQSDSA